MQPYAIEVESINKTFFNGRGLKDVILNPLNGKSFKEFMERPLSKLEQPIVALRDVSLKIPKGELWGLIGPNGSGKTTLIKILTTLLLPDSGNVHILGYNVEENEEKVRGCIGLIYSDERSFYWRLTGRENLEFFASLYGIKKRDILKKVNEVFSIVGLEDKADMRFDTYSTGMKRKMSIARGLLTDPDLLLIDEPTNGLDPLFAKKIITFLREELVDKRGKTILMATHNLKEAQLICDGAILLHKGQVKAKGYLDELQYEFNNSNLEEIFEKLAGD